MKRRGLHLLIPLLVIAIAAGLRLLDDRDFERLSLLSFDAYQRLQPRPYKEMPVRIVAVDDASLAEYGQWPWPRTLLARLIDNLGEAGAASVGFDIVFAEPDQTSPQILLPQLAKAGSKIGDLGVLATDLPDHDKLFAEALRRNNIVLGSILTSAENSARPERKAGFSFAGEDPTRLVGHYSGAVVNLPGLSAAGKGNGFLNHDPEWDRSVRRVPLVLKVGNQPVPSLAAEVLRVATGAPGYIGKGAGASGDTGFGENTGMIALRIGKDFTVPTDGQGRVWLHYTDPNLDAASARYISAKDILDGKFDKSLIEGNLVLVGATFAGSNDSQATPLTAALNGVEVHAQILEQVLQEWFLSRPDWAKGAETVFMVAVAVALILLLPYIGAVWSAAVAAVCLAAAAYFSWHAFTQWRMMFDPVYPAIVIVIVYGISTLLGYLRTEAQQREIRNAFTRYMHPALVDQLARNPDRLKLGGEMRTMTLMFCDIRGFTTISEGLDAAELTQLINEFLSPMTEIIMERQGTIDKYIGDCIMAFWNAPLDVPDHAAKAVQSAQAMRARLIELNADWEQRAKADGKPFKPVRIGIGINTGECCVGNMGSHQRFDYSVLGDAVNLASRLEGLGKTYGVDLVVGESTASMLEGWPLIELDLVAVKGKSQAVKIFTVLPEAEANQPAPASVVEHNRLLAAYRGQDWASAVRIIEDGLSDALPRLAYTYEVYKHRIEEFLEAPPPAEWDGVYVAKEK